MGYGLGGTVPIGDRHQVDDGVLGMQPGSYSWAGIAGTDVIIDPENDLAILFCTQVGSRECRSHAITRVAVSSQIELACCNPIFVEPEQAVPILHA